MAGPLSPTLSGGLECTKGHLCVTLMRFLESFGDFSQQKESTAKCLSGSSANSVRTYLFLGKKFVHSAFLYLRIQQKYNWLQRSPAGTQCSQHVHFLL